MDKEGRLIKSNSKYSLRKKHQNINDGTVMERDLSTINGINDFIHGQIPLYKSNNFIITVGNRVSHPKDLISYDFETWNLNDAIKSKTDNEQTVNHKKLYYKLTDFAYYGSCSELIRASINDIISKFPGELELADINGKVQMEINEDYLDKQINNKLNNNIKENLKQLKSSSYKFVIDNPFNVNLHTEKINKFLVDDSFKYFCNEGYKNYDIFVNGGKYNITKFSQKTVYGSTKDENCELCEKCGVISLIEIGYSNKIINICAYKDKENTNNMIVYFIFSNDNSINSLNIRPKNTFYNYFYEHLDNFEKILLNNDPLKEHSVIFEILTPNNSGYDSEFKEFIFPKKNGKYNLSVNDVSYNAYVNELLYYSNYYDEMYCDNLYRSMTHESIKNFDWTISRSENVENDIIEGGNKVAKLLRLFGREFDEIKYYIDNIKNYNNISYENSYIKNSLLLEFLNNDGWNPISIFPYDNELKQIINEFTIKPYSDSVSYGNSECKNGYFTYLNENCKLTKENNEDNQLYKQKNNILLNRVKKYTSEKEYTINNINNEFIKRLKLNSKHILRKKGTIECIESLLSIFGLKSNRMSNSDYDYRVIEYSTEFNSIKDKYNENYSKPTIDWYNSTKTISYNTESFRKGEYVPYQGLPVRGYVNVNGKNIDIKNYNNSNKLYELKKSVTLYPYFSHDMKIDGNPYYQMNGGWLRKSHKFNKNNELVNGTYRSYTETFRNIRTVNNLKELIDVPISTLKDNDIFYVKDLSNKYAVIDGIYYDLKYDNNIKKYYISEFVYNGMIRIGIKTFESQITISNENSQLETINLNTIDNNSEIRIYQYNDTFKAYGKYYGISNVITNLNESNEKSNYFKIININKKNQISQDGWVRLNNDDETLKEIDTIINNNEFNNPHSGNLNYDGGDSYLKLFTNLFKYSIDNEYFNKNCYTNFNDELENIKKIGFGFKSEKEKIDSKINDNTDNDISDDIVNLKRVDIIFSNTKNNNFVLKYLDSVIMGYLEQILPSTIICNTYYINKDIKQDIYTDLSVIYTSTIGKCDSELNMNNLKITIKKNGIVEEVNKSEAEIIYDGLVPNTTNSEKNIKITVKYKNNKATTHAIQEAGPCDIAPMKIYDFIIESFSIDNCGLNEQIVVKDIYDGNILKNNVDYYYTINNNGKLYTAYVFGLGNYSGIRESKDYTVTGSCCGADNVFDYSKLYFIADDMNACDTEAEITYAIIKNVFKYDDDCNLIKSEDILLNKNDYSLEYNPNGENQQDFARYVTVKMKTNSKYGNLIGESLVMQKSGPCSGCTVKSISVTPNRRGLNGDETIIGPFTVNIETNDSIYCSKEYKVVDPLGNKIFDDMSVEVPNERQFYLRNDKIKKGNYVITSLDNKNKFCILSIADCGCEITNISVSPSVYRIKEDEEETSVFTVTIDSTENSCCTKEFKVINPNGSMIIDAEKDNFTIPKKHIMEGKYEVISLDDESKKTSFKMTSKCEPSKSYENAKLSVSSNGKIDKCGIKNVKELITVKLTDIFNISEDCSESMLTETISDYTAEPNSIGANEDDTEKKHKVSITVSKGGKTFNGSVELTQNVGPCTETCTEHDIFDDAKMEVTCKCVHNCGADDMYEYVLAKISGIKHKNKDCTITDVTDWPIDRNYIISIESIEPNMTKEPKSFPIKVTYDLGSKHLEVNDVVNQSAGPCEMIISITHGFIEWESGIEISTSNSSYNNVEADSSGKILMKIMEKISFNYYVTVKLNDMQKISQGIKFNLGASFGGEIEEKDKHLEWLILETPPKGIKFEIPHAGENSVDTTAIVKTEGMLEVGEFSFKTTNARNNLTVHFKIIF